MRIIMYTGKGGVGKTTVSAATAVRCAQLGYRTVVLSTDLAHSLGDSFDRKLAPEPMEIAPIVGKSPNAVRVALHYIRKKKGKGEESLGAPSESVDSPAQEL